MQDVTRLQNASSVVEGIILTHNPENALRGVHHNTSKTNNLKRVSGVMTCLVKTVAKTNLNASAVLILIC